MKIISQLEVITIQGTVLKSRRFIRKAENHWTRGLQVVAFQVYASLDQLAPGKLHETKNWFLAISTVTQILLNVMAYASTLCSSRRNPVSETWLLSSLPLRETKKWRLSILGPSLTALVLKEWSGF